MSRSYKKHPFCKVINSDFKKFANKKVRKTIDIPNYASYKKNGYSWSIIDQISYETWEKYKCIMKHPCFWRKEYNEKDCRNDYEKWYIRK